jgi:hypothetical protein
MTETQLSRQMTNLNTLPGVSRMSTLTNATGFSSQKVVPLQPKALPEDLARGAMKLLFSHASHLVKQSSDLD